MKRFIGIVPDEDIYNTVLNIQRQFGDNRLEPHITVRPPVTVLDEVSWNETIENVCATFSPFTVSLPRTGFFGNRVLFIEGVSKELTDLHYTLKKAIKPFEQQDLKSQGNDRFHAHLTLGRLWCGFTKQDFAQMKLLADDYLAQDPVSFTVSSVRIYHKPSGNGRYEPLRDISFNTNI